MMASFGELVAEPAPAAMRVGADLRAARERLGWSLPALAAHLRIRLPYLEALEEGRVGDLPGTAYALGFLRTYAGVLGLDADEMSRRFRAEVAEANRKTELNFPVPVPQRGVPAGAVVLVGALLAIGAYIGWYHVSEQPRTLADAVPPVPQHLATLAEPPAPPPPSVPQTADATPPAPSAQTAAAAATPAEPPAPPVPAVSPSSAAAAPVMPAVPAVAPAAPPAPAAAPPAEPAPPHIVVHATADAWIQVRDRSGQVLLNRVLRSGESWTVPDRPSLLLTTGNAGGTELLVDGTAAASLGRDGAVRRDLPLDADAIRSGRLAPVLRHP